jgi:hypothetical protein
MQLANAEQSQLSPEQVRNIATSAYNPPAVVRE